MKYQLTSTRKVRTPRREETAYLYVGENGSKFEFHCHPTRKFAFVVLSAKEISERYQGALLDAWCAAGMRRRNGQSFDDAIKILEVA